MSTPTADIDALIARLRRHADGCDPPPPGDGFDRLVYSPGRDREIRDDLLAAADALDAARAELAHVRDLLAAKTLDAAEWAEKAQAEATARAEAEAEADRDERIVMAAESALCEHLRREGRPARRGSNSGETLAGLGDELERMRDDRDAARDEAGRHRSRCVSLTQEIAAARAQAEDGRAFARAFLRWFRDDIDPGMGRIATLDELRRMALRLLFRPVAERGDAGDAPGKPQGGPGASGEGEAGNRPAGLADGVAGLLGAPGASPPRRCSCACPDDPVACYAARWGVPESEVKPWQRCNCSDCHPPDPAAAWDRRAGDAPGAGGKGGDDAD